MMEAKGQVITTWEAKVFRADGTVEDLGVIARKVEDANGPQGQKEDADGPLPE